MASDWSTKTFVVTEKQSDGSSIVVAVKLTFDAAWSVAKLDGGRRVQKFTANKVCDMTAEEVENLQRERQA